MCFSFLPLCLLYLDSLVHIHTLIHPSSFDVTFKQVTGFFRTQLEDGIMGMNNKDGAFWFQLREHYKQMGYDNNSDNDNDGVHISDVADQFNPSQFSLCYDRQPISKNVDHGLGSGTLTLGGSDPLLHNTPMVYASNITPDGGWCKVRVTAMFLRTNGGTLLSVSSLTSSDTTTMTATDGITTDNMIPRYLRVHATEDDLNGGSDPQQGVIIDSGITDTYLPQTLAGPFQNAWVEALGGNNVYDNTPRELSIKQLRSLPTILIILRGHVVPSNVDNLEKGVIGMTRSHVSMFAASEEYPISDTDIVVAMPPGHYMEESSSILGMYTSRLYFTERPGSQSILGSNFLMGHDVLFDNGQGRIGFAESHCDYKRYVEERNTIIQQEQAGLEGQGR